jgi:hypothetical protein
LGTGPRKSLRETSGSFINDEELTTVWTGWENAAKNLRLAGCIISLALTTVYMCLIV